MAFRFDRFAPAKGAARRLDNGWLRVPAAITRTGIFEYQQPDGSVVRELRLPEHVFAEDALASFDLVPLTDDHRGMLDATTAENNVVGSVGKVRADASKSLVEAELLIYSAAAISKIEAGKTELSCGYDCDLVHAPGEWNGQKYDAIQTNIRGNHVAIVDRGRAGPEARIRLDAAGDAIPHRGDAAQEKQDMEKITINGITFDVPAQAAQAIQLERKVAADTLAAVRADADKAAARADAAEAAATASKAKLDEATSPAKLAEAVAARVALESQARRILGDEAKLDGLADGEIRSQVIAKLDPTAKLDGRSADYVTARFDAAIAHSTATNRTTADAAAKIASGAPRSDAALTPEERFRQAVLNAHKAEGK